MLSSPTQKRTPVHTPLSVEGHNTARKTSVVSLRALPAWQRKPLGPLWMQFNVVFSFSAVGARNLLKLQPLSPFVSYPLLMRGVVSLQQGLHKSGWETHAEELTSQVTPQPPPN